VFGELDEERFDLFVLDVLVECDRYQFGTLKERAVEMLLGHLLSISNPEDKVSAPLKSVKADDKGYDVSFQESPTDYSSTWFGVEYQRILKLVTGNAEIKELSVFKGGHYQGDRVDLNTQVW